MVHLVIQTNEKSNFLLLVLVHQRKNCSINFSKANANFCLSLLYNANNSYLFVHGKEIFKFKTHNKDFNALTQSCLGSISNGFSAIKSREVSLNGYMYNL